MQKQLHREEKTYEQVELVTELILDVGDQLCDIQDEAKIVIPCGTGGLCEKPDIGYMICMDVALVAKTVWLAVKAVLHNQYIYLLHAYDLATLGPGETMDTWTHAGNTAKHL